MKRREFLMTGAGAAALAAVPSVARGVNKMEEYVHDPRDYATVPEEPEEFQEYEVDVPEDWAEEELVWI